MPRTRPISELIDPILQDAKRRKRIEERARAIETALLLGTLREECGMTQSHVAREMNMSQPNVSRIEHEEDIYLSTLRGYVRALGGELEIRVRFPDRTVQLEPAPEES